MVLPIVKEIVERRYNPKEPHKDFIVGAYSCRTDLLYALNRYHDITKVTTVQGTFLGYDYNAPSEGRGSIIHVFCGADRTKREVLLRVSVHPAEQIGDQLVRIVGPLGSQEYILRTDNKIIVKKDDKDALLLDGTKKEHLSVLTKVQALADEVIAELDKRILKQAPAKA